ncbi:hypothetical protein G9A89_015166 [Geosiphon pyriformis]|nr:hypothetical protein G9A89_015166 [Geosiphon pyriformis]
MKKTASLAEENEIITNINIKKQRIHSDQAVVIKEIFIDMSKKMIITVVSEFGEIKLIKIQLIGMWQKAVVKFTKLSQAKQLVVKWSFLIGKDSVHVVMTVKDHDTWASRN